jgi:hypothetical protein
MILFVPTRTDPDGTQPKEIVDHMKACGFLHGFDKIAQTRFNQSLNPATFENRRVLSLRGSMYFLSDPYPMIGSSV